MAIKPDTMRVDKKFQEIVNYVIAQHLLLNKRPPSRRKITEIIARKIKKEDLLYDEFIKF